MDANSRADNNNTGNNLGKIFLSRRIRKKSVLTETIFFFHQGISGTEKWSIQATECAIFPASTDSAERFRARNYKTDTRNEGS